LSNPKEKFESKKLPMMPIRDVVIFPYMMTPFVVGRESSVRALEEALASDKKIFLATQHDASIDEPKAGDIFQVGTIVNIVQSLKLPDGNIKVLVEGIERGKILQVVETEDAVEDLEGEPDIACTNGLCQFEHAALARLGNQLLDVGTLDAAPSEKRNLF